MDRFLRDLRIRIDQLWVFLARPSQLEADPEFSSSLTEVMHEGFRWGSATIMIATVVHIAIAVFGKGESIVWMYSAQGGEVIAVAYHVLVFAIGVGLLGLSGLECSLRTGRWLGAIGAVVACGASLHDDLLHGGYVSLDFITMIYMVAVVMVPFRPGQALVTGGSILCIFALFVGPGVLLPSDISITVGVTEAAAGIGMAVVLGTAVSTVLYATRHTQHRIRRNAQERLRGAKEQAEQALETVEAQAEQLQEIDEMKSRFFANVSHELRTPLSLMIGPIERMLEVDERDEDEHNILEIVYRNAERLERLVGQLLNLARYDAGHLRVQLQKREWGPFVEHTARRFIPMAEMRGISLSVATDDETTVVSLDPDHMETVLANLIRNALTYTQNGGTVQVWAGAEGETAILTVEDDGPGIPKEKQEVLFDRFYRGAGQAQDGGTGIGLALAQALVTMHQGTIRVESAMGQGSRFTVRWPAALEDPMPAETAPRGSGIQKAQEKKTSSNARTGDPATDPTPLGNHEMEGTTKQDGNGTMANTPTDRTTILVVEDNADMRYYVRSLLEPQYHVIEAEGGSDGLRRARTALPDLVVADVMMPGMSGVAMLKQLRQSDRLGHIPVVLLTARAEVKDQVEGLQKGADAYVTKPFDAGVLTAQIDGLIATRRQWRERFSQGAVSASSSTSGGGPTSFMDRVRAEVEENLSDPEFSVADLAEAIGLTRRTVTRKVKKQHGQPPSALIRTMRLERGADLLDEGGGTISEVAYAVGFNSLSYFSRRFKEYFGVSPSEYRKGES